LSPGRRTPARSNEPQALGSVIEALGAERRLAAGLLLGTLGRRWDAVVGERLAEETAPAALDGGVLWVRASSAAWAAQIKFLAGEVTAAANRLLENNERPRAASPNPLGGGDEKPVREVRVVVEAGPTAR